MLTERIVREAKPDGKSRTIWDRKVPGLGLQVTRGGTKNFVIRYAVDGKRRQAIICRVGQLPLAEVRKRAGAELAAIRAGAADPLRRRAEAEAAPTVNEGLDRFFDEWAPRRIADGRLSERTVRDYRKQARLTLRPALGDAKIAAVTRYDIEGALAKVAPVQRNRHLALASRLFNLFETWDLRPQHSNPVRGIERAREEPRDRVLAPSELEALAGALDRCDDLFAVAAIRFLTLTGWRSGEALALRWEHVDFERGEALLPSTKAGRDNRPLGAAVLEMLAGLPRVNGNPHVFAGSRGAAIGYKKLRAVFARVCGDADVADCRLHDLRRSVATMAAASGVSVLMLRDLLGHKSTAMANRYARRASSALHATVDASADRMAAMLKPRKQGEIVEFPGRKDRA